LKLGKSDRAEKKVLGPKRGGLAAISEIQQKEV
jgi:hypothetical protein